MNQQQFLDGLTPLQRRMIQIVISLSENETTFIQVKDILKKLAMKVWNMDQFEFEASCEDLSGFVEMLDSYSTGTVGYAYRVLLRMGQAWNCRYPYFDFHGPIGDLHDDQPSGPEYLQLRLSRFFYLMMPEGNPPLLPLSLLNGTTTSDGEETPSHHLNELWMAMEEVRQNPQVTLEELIEIMPGPDFASGGAVCGNDSIRSFYRAGKGTLTLRGSIETLIEGPSTRIAITSLPKGVLVQSIIGQIRKIFRHQTEIHGFKDASTQTQVRIILDASRNFPPSTLKALLFKETDLEQQVPFTLPGGASLISVLKEGVAHCSPAWKKKSGDKTEFVPLLRDILKHGGYKSPLSDLGDERRTRVLEFRNGQSHQIERSL
jgi:hypothetical protein